LNCSPRAGGNGVRLGWPRHLRGRHAGRAKDREEGARRERVPFVPQTIEILIGKGYPSEAWRGHLFVDADLLDAGRFAWGLVQHEYGHQVDY
jgi:hypothetical protein